MRRAHSEAAGPLILVNRSHPLRAMSEPQLAPALGDTTVRLERRAAALLEACVRSVGGLGDIVPVSGWRSRGEQQAIWDGTMRSEGEEFTRKYVAAPGCSEHQTGLAIDLGWRGGDLDFIRPEFPDSGVCREFKRAAARYGFILRYPEGKERITGIAHEPWHFRYVGPPHAIVMDGLGLCLEEYIALLCSHPPGSPLRQRCCGYEISVCRTDGSAPPRAGMDDSPCLIVSGDNCGGLVYASWRRCC